MAHIPTHRKSRFKNTKMLEMYLRAVELSDAQSRYFSDRLVSTTGRSYVELPGFTLACSVNHPYEAGVRAGETVTWSFQGHKVSAKTAEWLLVVLDQKPVEPAVQPTHI